MFLLMSTEGKIWIVTLFCFTAVLCVVGLKIATYLGNKL